VSTRLSVKVHADQFDRLARPSQPLAGVAELVWNSLDAEAEVVTVSIERNDLGAVESVVVTDDGHGMTYQESVRDFERLGGSWKREGTIIGHQTDLPLPAVPIAEYGMPELRILEWAPSASGIRPTLVFCDENGVALYEIELLNMSGGSRFTAYITWAGFAPFAAELPLAELGHPVLGSIFSTAQDAIHAHLAARVDQERIGVIERWKAQRVYPYAGEPPDPIEQHERRVFDAVAVTAAPAVATEPAAARLSLRLLQAALAESPAALHRVLREVLELTPEQLADLDRLLQRTTLASLIHTSKLVADRLDFLADLEHMLFDKRAKKQLLERRELHRILANGRTWVFGEDYSLAVDDQGLTKVLTAHRSLLGQDEQVTEPVRDTEGRTRIIDLMLSRASLAHDRRQHLVVELKRPSARLTQQDLAQITTYAVAVVKDERFAAPSVSWDFWLVGDDVDDVVSAITNVPDRPAGLYASGSNFRIWVRRWAEILEENRQRLHFYRDHLDYQADADADLQATLSRYLPHQREELVSV
jgi:hypothetical protein